ncbi:unnamed protein product [Sphenostylis stenocarpa]|uniref:Uncharacterized protein n=1 Tax=Sphenostylis stenocarpa TaxID=92480 RepID=A0AA86S5V6_9FABA|nr:unnamed protein product [Sphenostylis stenocarpa]
MGATISAIIANRNFSLVHASWKKHTPLSSRETSPQPPDFGVNLFLKKPSTTSKPTEDDLDIEEEHDEEEDGNIGVVWESDELEAISSLFQGRIP